MINNNLKEIFMKTNMYNKYEDTSAKAIAEAANLLSRKPARQGSNQYVEPKPRDNPKEKKR